MKIQKINIINFRSIKELEICLNPYMVFVGKNNSGKSNIMKALLSFFENSINIEDFRKLKGEIKKNLRIIVKFVDLTPGEFKLYSNRKFNNGKKTSLIIKFEAILEDSGKIITKYSTYRVTIDPDSEKLKKDYKWLFDPKYFRSENKILESEEIDGIFKEWVNKKIQEGEWKHITEKRFIELRKKYISEIIDIKKYPNLERWEELKVSRNNIKDYLGNYFFIPAVQDIEKETKYLGKGSTNFNNLINYILEQMRDPIKIKNKREEIRKVLEELFRLNESDSEMNRLREELNEILKHFDNSKIYFQTSLPKINKMLRDSLSIYIDDGVKTEVNHKGHGLQRYFMVSLFKIWSKKLMEKRLKGKSSDEIDGDSIAMCNSAYFAIEEPELFLHPQYQRMMRDYLQEIAFTEHNQILLNTHSPNFIEFDSVDDLAKVIKKSPDEGTMVIQPLCEKDGELSYPNLIKTWGSKENRKKYSLINKINMGYYLNRERNEMFFADKVVLVEGQTEKMLLDAWAKYYFHDDIGLINKVSYIDCLGKFNFQQYIEILKVFGISFVAIVDSDSNKSQKTKENNTHIKRDTFKAGGIFLELEPEFEDEFGIEESEISKYGQKVYKPYFAFKKYFNLETGEPIKKELDLLRENPKLRQIFKAIYGKDI